MGSSFLDLLSPASRQTLQKANLSRAADVLLRFPLRYENWHSPSLISSLSADQTAVVEGTIDDAQRQRWRQGKMQLLVHIKDDEGGILTARFFNATNKLEQALPMGRRLRVMGVIKDMGGWVMLHPKIQSAATDGKMQAIYSILGKLTQEKQRQIIELAMRQTLWTETVPEHLRNFNGGEYSVQHALTLIHCPPPDNAALIDELISKQHPVWQRLRFDELLAHQIILRNRYRRRNKMQAPVLKPPTEWDANLRNTIPFELTNAQKKAIAEISDDLCRNRPMQRLLQGDVGSGKTIVAVFACLQSIKSGYPAILMAPTEILASQHYETFSQYFNDDRIQCELIMGAIRGNKRRDVLARLRLGLSHMIIGTHALFQETPDLPRAGIIIIDEQHRFGVEQRKALLAAGKNIHDTNSAAHQLMMSATPIPRTLAMSAFADMNMSILNELPAGRQPVTTLMTPCQRRDEVLARLADNPNNAAYWVCPRIEESENDDLQDVLSLQKKSQQHHPQLISEILHGRMSAAEKQSIIDRFRANKIKLLLATTVIEVGVDVPQADIMIIDHAERLGLSQLHQLRGRVGRSDRPGVCILLYADNLSDDAKARLKILRQTNDGFKIAEHDLNRRGPGEWLGTRQSGLPTFRVMPLKEDAQLIHAASQAAKWLMDNDHRACAIHIRRWLSGRFQSKLPR